MLADWALDRHPRETGLRIAELAGCPLEPESALVDCFRDMDVTTLRNAQKAYSVQNFNIVSRTFSMVYFS